MANIIKSFRCAINGIIRIAKKERNFKIHLFASFIIILLGVFLGFERLEWLVVLLLIAMVLSAEIVNSAIEGICDLLKKKLDLKYEETTNIRDFGAAAVLIIAVFAVFIGILLIANRLI